MTYATAKKLFDKYKFDDVIRCTLKKHWNQRYVDYYERENCRGFYIHLVQFSIGDELSTYLTIGSTYCSTEFFSGRLSEIDKIWITSKTIEVLLKNGVTIRILHSLELKEKTE